MKPEVQVIGNRIYYVVVYLGDEVVFDTEDEALEFIKEVEE